jgi:uncharacterized membrane protein
MPRKEKVVHLLFLISVIGKGIDGILETVGGMILFFLDPAQINHVVRALTQHELSEDPNDLVAGYLVRAAHHLSVDTKTFGAAYLLVHGVVKVGLIAGLLRRRLWAYPLAIVAFVAFVLYQIYRYSHTHADYLLFLSALDAVVIGLTWLEYRRLRFSHGFA